MTTSIRATGRAAVCAILCVGACSSGTLAPAGKPGQSVLTAAVVKVTFQSAGGGFHGRPPVGAPCDPAQWSYAITLANHEVAWAGCSQTGDWTDPNSYAPATAYHTLDSSTWSTVRTALAGVTVSGGTGCGADKDQWTLTTETQDTSETYGDDFYACQKQYAGYVTSDSLDALAGTLANLD